VRAVRRTLERPLKDVRTPTTLKYGELVLLRRVYWLAQYRLEHLSVCESKRLGGQDSNVNTTATGSPSEVTYF